MRSTYVFLFAVGALLAPDNVSAETPATTRVETRPFYGATVTLEEGVRVFRPLPPHDRIIINPGGRTPLSLSYEERRSVSHNYHYGSAESRDADSYPVGIGAYGRGRSGPHHHDGGGAMLSGGGHGSGGRR